MKTPRRSADTRAEKSATAKGENHDASGEADSSVPLPVQTLISATAAKTRSASTWHSVSTFCSRADSSVPITQIAVMTTITATARTVTATFDPAAPCAPTSS